jgi:hypothetical protein
MRRQIATYVTEEEFQQLTRQAARRDVSLSRYVKEHLLKADDGSGAEPAGEAVAEAISTAERRLAEGVERALARAVKPLTQRLGILTAMLDQFALTMLINTPEIAENKKEQAIAAGERRHRGWQRAVELLLKDMQPETATVDNGTSGNGARA